MQQEVRKSRRLTMEKFRKKKKKDRSVFIESDGKGML